MHCAFCIVHFTEVIIMLFHSSNVPTWLVVFLGNPGPKYAGTRHNAGFMTGDVLAKELDVSINKARFDALTASCTIGGQSVLLMKPQTYMNLSGEAVGKAAKFYKIEPAHVLVVSDEMSLPIGRIRVRPKGSAGGHNGLKNIIEHLGTEDFPRIRIGVGAPPKPGPDQVDWVLGVPKNEDAVAFAAATELAADAVVDYITNGAEHAMSHFNKK